MTKQKIRPASCRRCNYFGKFSFVPLVFAGGLTGFTVLSGILLSASSSFAANTGNLQTTVNVPASCSLTVNPSSHTVTINPGNTGLIGTSTIKSICNDPAGLAVYAVGYTGDTYGNTNLASTVGSNTYNIATHVTPSGTPESSEWYMTLAAVSGDYTPTIATGYDSAHIIPDVYTKVAYRNTMTDIGTNATGAQFTASFNAYIAPAQAADTYTGKVKFLLVHPNVLTWQEDSQNPGTMIPATEQPATMACSPESLKLQDVSTWGSTVSLGETVEAIDTRDCQTYKVKRLKMNVAGTETALWMSNLNLGAETLTVSQLDNTNTHLASGVSAIQAATFTSWIESSGTSSYTDPELIPIKSSNTCTVSDGSNNTSTGSCPEQDSYGNKYGTLYNYAAASAGTYTYADGAGTGNAASDLCPFGWRMPTGGDSGEFQALTDSYGLFDYDNWEWNTGGFVSIQQDLGFPLAGNFGAVEPSLLDSYAHYWSSTFYDGEGMYILFFFNNALDSAWSDGRSYGFSLRCVSP